MPKILKLLVAVTSFLVFTGAQADCPMGGGETLATQIVTTSDHPNVPLISAVLEKSYCRLLMAAFALDVGDPSQFKFIRIGQGIKPFTLEISDTVTHSARAQRHMHTVYINPRYVTRHLMDGLRINRIRLEWTLAHEMGHFALNAFWSSGTAARAYKAAGACDKLIRLGHENEKEADYYAYKLLRSVGYTHNELVAVVTRLYKDSPADDRCSFEPWSHPSGRERIAAIRSLEPPEVPDKEPPLAPWNPSTGASPAGLEGLTVAQCSANVPFRDPDARRFRTYEQARDACGSLAKFDVLTDSAVCPSQAVPGPYCGTYFVDPAEAHKHCDTPDARFVTGSEQRWYCLPRKLIGERAVHYAFRKDAVRECGRYAQFDMKLSNYTCPFPQR